MKLRQTQRILFYMDIPNRNRKDVPKPPQAAKTTAVMLPSTNFFNMDFYS
ncbi:hypothetical protein NEIFLAOT_00332 [Neisseria flavescens NRL30031/H210]|uniref:Uncharacterized protein n=1 Tax=Neisseria flavescens NRL30031/H210 TaxID=546264 RepID=C0EK90_NEIFL|nr:hypothetical protein NEIFLAOT_00332 [Neisseria flavescens NRL30031/H210]